MRDDQIVHPIWEPRPVIYDPDAYYEPTLRTRTETLRKFAAVMHVDKERLDASSEMNTAMIEMHLRDRIEHDVAKAGRQVHGEFTMDQHEDFLRNVVAFRVTAMTRERTDGSWPSVWAAFHEDEEDRREALRHPTDDLDD